MPIIHVKENEHIDVALRKFKRLCEKTGIISECKKREFYEKPTWKRKRLKDASKKKYNRNYSNLTKSFSSLFIK